MFGIGIGEIALIVLVALIFIRPRDLPRVLRKLGALYRKTTEQLNAAKTIVREMEQELDTAQEMADANEQTPSDLEE